MPTPHLLQRIMGTAHTPAPQQPATPAEPGSYVGEPHRPGGARAARGVGIALLVLLLAVGTWHTFGRPIANAMADPAPPAPHVQGVDAAAARQLATAFTADYWSYDSSNPRVRAAALARWSATTPSTSTGPTLTGTGQLRTDLVTAGAAAEHGTDQLVVQTTARVTPATLRPDATLPEQDTQDADAPRAADPGPATGPWQPTTPRWLTLNVVITDTDGTLTVTAAALTGDAPAALPRTTPESDSRLGTTLTDAGLPTDVFTAYAAGSTGQLGYITTPHVQLAGLGGQVQLGDLSGWSVTTDTGDGSRYATAQVTWQLAGTELAITQPYALHLTQVDGRWLVAAIGTRLEN